MKYLVVLSTIAASIVWLWVWFDLAIDPTAPEIMSPLAAFMMVAPFVAAFIYFNS